MFNTFTWNTEATGETGLAALQMLRVLSAYLLWSLFNWNSLDSFLPVSSIYLKLIGVQYHKQTLGEETHLENLKQRLISVKGTKYESISCVHMYVHMQTCMRVCARVCSTVV